MAASLAADRHRGKRVRARFRAVAWDGRPALAGWQQGPTVGQWQGDLDHGPGLLAGDIGSPPVEPPVALLEDTAFGHAEARGVKASGVFHDRPAGVRLIAAIEGRPGFLGTGHGAGTERAAPGPLAAAATPRVLIDLDPDNARAIRADGEAGFRSLRLHEAADGTVLPMARDPRAERTRP